METTLPLMLRARAAASPDLTVQLSKDASGSFAPTSFAAFYDLVRDFAAGLRALGVRRGDHVGLISDNRREWLIADFALLCLGAADVPRGCDSTDREIAYILGFADCRLSFAENRRQAEKILGLKEQMPQLTTLVLFDAADAAFIDAAAGKGVSVLAFADMQASGASSRAASPAEIDAEIALGRPDELATIIFTSGTTGEPKGVMITHANFLHQLPTLPLIADIKAGDIWLAVLPVWHSFERLIQYVAVERRCALAYSKPVGSVMLGDLALLRPQWMASVPRIWESVRDGIYRSMKQQGGAKKVLFDFFIAVGIAHAASRNLARGLVPNFGGRLRFLDAAMGFLPWMILSPLRALGEVLVYRKITAKLGGRFTAGISGGGALPAQVDRFFSAVGVTLLEGYGLTETAPVIAVRRQSAVRLGVVGQLMLGTEVRIVDEGGADLPVGRKGLILVRGGQVMKGYCKRPDATAKVLRADGWLDTGDLGMMTVDGEIKITGRAKDTIVLRGGENVEPTPIEEKMRESELVSQVMVVGQDQKFLAALIVPAQEALTALAKSRGIVEASYEALLKRPEVSDLVGAELGRLVSAHHGFKAFERIYRFKLLAKPFEVGVELSHKQEVMRHKVVEIYAKDVAALFA